MILQKIQKDCGKSGVLCAAFAAFKMNLSRDGQKILALPILERRICRIQKVNTPTYRMRPPFFSKKGRHVKSWVNHPLNAAFAAGGILWA